MISLTLQGMTEYEFFQAVGKNKNCSIEDFSIDFSLVDEFKNKLIDKGLNINFDGKIFQIDEQIIPLDGKIIRNKIASKYQNFFSNIHVIYQTESTNQEIKKLNTQSDMLILLAEYQCSGKGRRGNHWLSPVGKNIYLSIKFDQLATENISYFPLYIATVIAGVLQSFGIKNIKVKWPNDIYVGNAKMAGLIVERIIAMKEKSSMILGIGINVNMDSRAGLDIQKDITSMKDNINNSVIDRNEVLAMLLPKLSEAIQHYSQITFHMVKNSWAKYNLLEGKELLIKQENQQFYAKYMDINNDGSLRVLKNDEILDVYAGDVSIKSWTQK